MKKTTLNLQARDRLNNFNLCLLLAFFLAVAIGIVNHEMWRDELTAWLIARDSLSVSELLENLEFEGHPSLWYLCLHLLSKFTNNPLVLQLFQLIIATSVVFIFVCYSTFNNLQKALFCFGYFPLYEYGVIARSYSLGVLLIFSFCALFCRKNNAYIYLAIILALLSHTNVYGMAIGFSLAMMLALAIAQDNHLANSNIFRQPNLARKIVISTAVYLFGLLTAIVQIIPPTKIENIYVGRIGSTVELYESNISTLDKVLEYIRDLIVPITGIWRSYVPIPNISADYVWGTNILLDNPQLREIATISIGSFTACLSLILFLFFSFVFIRQYKVLLLYVIGNLSIISFGWLVKLPAIRHNGHLFILLIACCWIYLYQVRQNKSTLASLRIVNLCRKYHNSFLTLILCIQLYAGIQMYSIDLFKPFSSSKSVAQFIRNNGLEDLTIVGSRDVTVSPLSAWLNRKIYYPGIQDFGTHTAVTTELFERNRDITQPDIIKETEKLIKRDQKSLLLILSNNKLQETSTSLEIELLKSFENSMTEQEKYYVYYVSPK